MSFTVNDATMAALTSLLKMNVVSISAPANFVKAVTPDDAADLPSGVCRALYVGGAGNVIFHDADGNQLTLVSEGCQYHPIQARRVLATDTTATNVLALY